jgi:hypothetical protein
VILLGDSDYEQGHVTTQITKIIPQVQKEEAMKCYVEAQMVGEYPGVEAPNLQHMCTR